MSLDTLIASHLLAPTHLPRASGATALVLMGGGARTAYQAGVLRAIAHMKPAAASEAFPFQLLLGTSAGALNATYLASQVGQGWAALPDWPRSGCKCGPTKSTAWTHHAGRAPTSFWRG